MHTLGALYESMLCEMRDAAGDSGEFYTPRAIVRFMVAVTECLHTATGRNRARPGAQRQRPGKKSAKPTKG